MTAAMPCTYRQNGNRVSDNGHEAKKDSHRGKERDDSLRVKVNEDDLVVVLSCQLAKRLTEALSPSYVSASLLMKDRTDRTDVLGGRRSSVNPRIENDRGQILWTESKVTYLGVDIRVVILSTCRGMERPK
jgi:hypothetical protein